MICLKIMVKLFSAQNNPPKCQKNLITKSTKISAGPSFTIDGNAPINILHTQPG